jgi:membrane fusion protein, multidrug efflux system
VFADFGNGLLRIWISSKGEKRLHVEVRTWPSRAQRSEQEAAWGYRLRQWDRELCFSRRKKERVSAKWPSDQNRLDTMPAEIDNNEAPDPGLIALVILLRRHGIAVGREHIRGILEQCGTATIGLVEMVGCARQLGFRAHSQTINWRRVARIPLPAIAALRDGGFLVIAKVDERYEKVLVQHPSSSRAQVMTRAELEAVWDRRILFFDRPGKKRPLSIAVRWAFGVLAFIIVASLTSSLGWHLISDVSSFPPVDEPRVKRVPAVPITAATVERKDVPIYLSGLGTVQASKTVRVTSRVEGQLQKLGFQEGQDVRAGDVLAQIDPLPFQATLRQMEANLRRDQAQLRNAQLELERTISLRDYASRQNVDLRRSTVEQLEAAIEADHAQIESAKIQLDYTVIRSPIDGRAGIRLIDEGNMIRASDPTGVVVLTQLQPIEVIFALPEEDLPKINARLSAGGAPAVMAFGRDGQTVLAEGVLSTVDNIIDRKTGTFKLKALFPNEKKILWPGQFINARIHVATRQGGIVVSEAAVQRGPDGPYVFVVEPENTVTMRTIKIAQTEAGIALIDDGLSPGQRVVIEGQYRLQQGSLVLEVKS